jgi:hypothetical protein
LSEVTFEPESLLKEVGDFAFFGCNVERIEIPEKCEIMSGLSLIDIKNISIRKGNRFFIIEDCSVKSANGKEMIRYFGFENRVVVNRVIERISAGCFHGYKSLNEVTFESDCELQCIGKEAFRWSGVKTIQIPSNVEIIGEGCFRQCQSLSEVTFESGCKLRRIEKHVFSWSGVKMIQIPSSVEVIGEECFRGCISLSEITFESGCKLQRIEDEAFRESGVKRIRIPSSVEMIGWRCFCGCESLCEVNFEGRISDMDDSMFAECDALICVRIPRGVKLNCEFRDDCVIEYLDPENSKES